MSETVVVPDDPTVVVTPEQMITVVLTDPQIIVTPEQHTDVVLVPADTIVVNAGVGPQGPRGLTGDDGPQGPQGPTGPGGIASRVEFTVIAGFDLSGHRVVVPRAIDIHTVRYGQNTVASHAGRPMWLTLGAAMAGNTVTVVSHGLVEEPSWNWADGPIYLADTGLLTQTAPTPPGAAFLCAVGYAVDATSMFFDRSLAIALT